MGKTRDLFKKTGGTKGTFYTRMGMIKDRSHYHDLTEAEEIRKRWQQYTEVYKMVLMAQITMRCHQSPRTRHLGLQSQMGLWKLYYEQSQWK